MKTIRTNLNYEHNINNSKDVPIGVSLTIPEQTMSLNQIIQRYTRGQEVVKYNGTYANLSHDDIDLSKFNKFDPVDRMKIAEAYNEKLKWLKEKVEADQQDSLSDTDPDDKNKTPNITDPTKVVG